MRVKLSLILLLAATPLHLLQLASAFDLNALAEVANERPVAESKIPSLFDFNNYKRQFGKRYGSSIEELNRRRLYLSRALRALASGLSYKLYKSTSYNAINELSDLSAAELDKMANRALAEQEAQSTIDQLDGSQSDTEEDEDTDDESEFISHEGEDLEEELARLIEENPNEMGYEELMLLLVKKAEANKRSARKKREAPEEPEVEGPLVREFPLEKLIHAQLAEVHVSPKLTRQVDSNNPNYEPAELHSYGLTDQQEEVERAELSVPDERPLREQIKGYLELLRDKTSSQTMQKKLFGFSSSSSRRKPDEVFYDSRQTNCFAPVRQQKNCGACYAFAATAIMEWLHCKQTGKLVEFSEQYMIDCGRNRFEGLVLRGCQGGDIFATAKFAHNFGMETRSNYPYFSAEGVCPYSESHDLNKTGYIRMEIGRLLRVHMRHWPSYIKRGPMYVTVQTGNSDAIFEYGGGVDQCEYCAKGQGYHAMVLVGHGRESGQEYWLLRNSFGPTWGSQGYWKLSKRAAEKFVHAGVGWMYGTTRDGAGLDFKARLTERENGDSSSRTALRSGSRPEVQRDNISESGRPNVQNLAQMKW